MSRPRLPSQPDFCCGANARYAALSASGRAQYMLISIFWRHNDSNVKSIILSYLCVVLLLADNGPIHESCFVPIFVPLHQRVVHIDGDRIILFPAAQFEILRFVDAKMFRVLTQLHVRLFILFNLKLWWR